MKTSTYLLMFVMLLSVGAMSSCKKSGCVNVNACNYDPDAPKKMTGPASTKVRSTFGPIPMVPITTLMSRSTLHSSTTVELADCPDL